MEAVEPRVRVKRISCAPLKFPCPQCGKNGRRKDVHTRLVRDIAYGEVVVLEVEVGEYRARCCCCKTFRAQVEGMSAGPPLRRRVIRVGWAERNSPCLISLTSRMAELWQHGS
jgi:hypothetical protein